MLVSTYYASRADFETKGDGDAFEYTFFIEKGTGRRILVTHGREDGTWPKSSAAAIEKFNPDVIHCCHPRQMKRMTGDMRVHGINKTENIYAYIVAQESDLVVIAVHENW